MVRRNIEHPRPIEHPRHSGLYSNQLSSDVVAAFYSREDGGGFIRNFYETTRAQLLKCEARLMRADRAFTNWVNLATELRRNGEEISNDDRNIRYALGLDISNVISVETEAALEIYLQIQHASFWFEIMAMLTPMTDTDMAAEILEMTASRFLRSCGKCHHETIKLEAEYRSDVVHWLLRPMDDPCYETNDMASVHESIQRARDSRDIADVFFFQLRDSVTQFNKESKIGFH
ncbi:hypothetical protein AK830_g10765 [Neonectria ditissima]|uniref:Uncharacterized protein n=1 Tax=Neonectria ditissima TaxID=78410 RepID=A0A0P7B9R8_9HYPO|nr:hypothetical protein AK830_g10765 [Neonectria ditissima]